MKEFPSFKSESKETSKQLKEFIIEEMGVLQERFNFGPMDRSGQIELKIGDEEIELGSGTTQNSILTLQQFWGAIAATSNIAIDEIKHLNTGKETYKANITEWQERQVLSDLKIIDLGCGDDMTYLHLCKKLGAEVWGVDIKKPEDLARDWQLSEEDFVLLKESYIQADLTLPEDIEKIVEATGAKFNFVSEAHLNSEAKGKNGLVQLGDLARRLISKNGVFLDQSNNWNKNFIHASEIE